MTLIRLQDKRSIYKNDLFLYIINDKSKTAIKKKISDNNILKVNTWE